MASEKAGSTPQAAIGHSNLSKTSHPIGSIRASWTVHNGFTGASMSEELALDDLEDELLMDESMTPLERIAKLNKSNVMLHRLVVARELPSTIQQYSVSDAVNRILPIVLEICNAEPEDTIRETFVSELDKIILYYYQNAPPVPGAQGQKADPQQITIPTAQTMDVSHEDQEELDTISVPAPKEDDETKTPTSPTTSTAHDDQPYNHTTNLPVTAVCLPEGETDSPSSPKQLHPKSESGIKENLHIPNQAFAQLLIDLLLDQNSNLASLGQQCIVSVADELVSSPELSSLVDSEIFEGIVMGLMALVDGKQRQDEAEHDNEPIESEHEVDSEDPDSGAVHRRSSTPGFDRSPADRPSSDDMDQGEINLAKMMCLTLISALAKALGPERCVNNCLPIVERMIEDTFYVRKEAVKAIGSLATVVQQDVVVNRLLPLYENFTKDSIWHVRRSCVLTLPMLCEALPDDKKTEVAVDGVETFKHDASRNVRNTLAEVVGELIARFLPKDWEITRKPGKVPESLLDFFLSLGTDSSQSQMFKLETERAIICAYNFPAVVLTAGADYWDSHLKDTYLSLTKDYQIKVRRTFAYSLHEVAKIIGPERTERDLVQIFALYLMDLDDVKQGVLEHLAEFLGTLAVSSRNEYIPILAEVWDGVIPNWRLRDILAKQLRDIAMLFDASRVVEHVLPLAIRACNDDFAAVRETVVDAFPAILDIVKRAIDENGETLSQDDDEEYDEDDEESSPEDRRRIAEELQQHVLEKLDELVHPDRYRSRLVFSHLCGALLQEGISTNDFVTFFLPSLLKLVHDPVVNVRIAAARTLQILYTNDTYMQDLKSLTLMDMDNSLYDLALDRDPDVRSFVIDLVDADHLQELKEMRDRKEILESQKQEEALSKHQELVDEDDLSSVDATPMQEIEGATVMDTQSDPVKVDPMEEHENTTSSQPDTVMEYSVNTIEGDEDELMTESEPELESEAEDSPEPISEAIREASLHLAPVAAADSPQEMVQDTTQDAEQPAALQITQKINLDPAMEAEPAPMPASETSTPAKTAAAFDTMEETEAEMNIDLAGTGADLPKEKLCAIIDKSPPPPTSSGEGEHA